MNSTVTSLIVTKVIAAITLFAITLVAGIGIPSVFVLYNKYHRHRHGHGQGQYNSNNRMNQLNKPWYSSLFSYKSLMKLLMYFGGGVLFSTCFIHMIPEIVSDYANYRLELEHKSELDFELHESSDHHQLNLTTGNTQHGDLRHGHSSGDAGGASHDHSKIPIIELWICLGFFCLFLMEELVHSCTSHDHGDDHDHGHGKSSEKSDQSTSSISVSGGSSLRTGSIDMIVTSDAMASYTQHSMDTRHDLHGGLATVIAAEVEIASQGESFQLKEMTKVDVTKEPSTNDLTGVTVVKSASGDSASDVESGFRSKSITPTVPGDNSGNPGRVSRVKDHIVAAIVILLAFSAHSIFDGVTIGVQSDSLSVWKVFFAITCHKSVVSTALGMQLFEKSNHYLVTLVNMVLFSVMSPIGIVLTFFTKSADATESVKPMMEIALSALATGTILYIVFFEILQRNRSDDPFKLFGLILFASMLSGFGVMFCLTVYVT